MNTKTMGVVAAALFIGTVWAANWAVQRYGVVNVGFGLEAPAGVYFVGLAFGLRDVTHHILGRATVIGCILVGAALSYWVSDVVTIPGGHLNLALASCLAFLVSPQTCRCTNLFGSVVGSRRCWHQTWSDF